MSVRQDALIKTAHASRISQSQRSVAWHADRTWSGPFGGGDPSPVSERLLGIAKRVHRKIEVI
jgi:hypothetical protein